MKTVFEFRPNTVFSNSFRFSLALDPGACMAMTCDWAKTTLTYGRCVPERLSPAKWHIAQSAYEIGHADSDLKIIDAFGLKVRNNKGRGTREHVGASGVVADRLAGLTGTYVWGLESDNGAHAMGYRRLDGRREFFDPNFGLYEFDDPGEFRATVGSVVQNVYPDLVRFLDVYEVRM